MIERFDSTRAMWQNVGMRRLLAHIRRSFPTRSDWAYAVGAIGILAAWWFYQPIAFYYQLERIGPAINFALIAWLALRLFFGATLSPRQFLVDEKLDLPRAIAYAASALASVIFITGIVFAAVSGGVRFDL